MPIVDLSKMTKAELVAFAKEQEVKLYASDNTKAEIIARIVAALPPEEEPAQDVASDQQGVENEITEYAVVSDENAIPETEETTPLPISMEKHGLTISNPTTSARGLMLKKGVLLLQPGEVRKVPDADEEEVRALFSSKAIQAIVDAGLLRFSGMKDEELVTQETPEPPSTLTDAVQVSGTGLLVGANATRHYDPEAQAKMQNAGTMTIG